MQVAWHKGWCTVTDSPTDDGFPAPPSTLLADDVVELRLLRVLGPQNASERPAHEQFLARVPEYRFAIHRLPDGLRIGRIHIRVTNDDQIVNTIGHSGYAVDVAHRGNGYAARAIKLIVGLAKHWEVLPIWILIEPGNIASRRSVEQAGFELVDVIDSPEELNLLGVGANVCRYRSAG